MRANYDAIILGAGIVGAACALEFAKGGISVAIVERDNVGSGATGAAMGHIVAMDDSEAQFALTAYSQSLWSALAPELPPSVEYNRRGTLWVADDEDEMAELVRKREFYSARGIPAAILDANELAAAEPNLTRSLAGGLLVPTDAIVDPAHAAIYLIEQARRHGAELLLGRSAGKAASGRLILEDGTELTSPVIVNATGSFAAHLTPGVAIRRRKGHLRITDPCPGFLNHQVVELGYLNSAHAGDADSVAFNVQPRRNGQILIGSSRQYGSEDTNIDPHIVEAMIARASLYMPGLASLSTVRTWSGFRAATPDKLPLIGPTEDPTIFLAAGHEGLGITTSLATGRLLADHLLGRDSQIPITPYLPSRMSAPRSVASDAAGSANT